MPLMTILSPNPLPYQERKSACWRRPRVATTDDGKNGPEANLRHLLSMKLGIKSDLINDTDTIVNISPDLKHCFLTIRYLLLLPASSTCFVNLFTWSH